MFILLQLWQSFPHIYQFKHLSCDIQVLIWRVWFLYWLLREALRIFAFWHWPPPRLSFLQADCIEHRSSHSWHLSCTRLLFLDPASHLALPGVTRAPPPPPRHPGLCCLLLASAQCVWGSPSNLIFHFVLDASLGDRYTWILLKGKHNLRVSFLKLRNLLVAFSRKNGNIWPHSGIPLCFPIFMQMSFYRFLEWSHFLCFSVYWFEGHTDYHYLTRTWPLPS